MDLHLPVLQAGPLELSTWTLLGRGPVVLALAALALTLVPRAGWRRAALGLSGLAAGLALGAAVLPSVLGALAGGLIGGALTLRLLGAPLPGAVPTATALLGAVAVGRLGCLLNGCCFGTPTSLPWAVRQPAGAFAADLHAHLGLVPAGAPSLPIHPWPLYEALALAALLAALPWLARRLRSGAAAALAVAAGDLLLRAALDPLRGMLNTGWSVVQVGLLSAFQWAALAAAVAALTLAWRLARRAARAPVAGRAGLAAGPAAEPAAGRLALAWIAQAALLALASPRLTAFLAALGLGTLAAAGALLLPGLLAPQGGHLARRRLAASVAALLLVPAGLRAAGGPGLPERAWIYAVADGAGSGGEPAPDQAAPGVEPVAPGAAAPAAAEGEPGRLVRIGDQATPEAELAARAAALSPRSVARLSAFAGGGHHRYSSGAGCGGPVVHYDRDWTRAGASYERTTASLDRDGNEAGEQTWQLRAAWRHVGWEDSQDRPAPGTSPVLGRGAGDRVTVGGLYEWERPGAGFAIGGLLGRDTTRESLRPYFTRGDLVVHPALWMRLGWRSFGVEGGTLTRALPTDQPFAGLYLGPPTSRFRVGWTSAYLGGTAATASVAADFQLKAGPTWLQLHLDGGNGTDLTARIGYEFP
jgi:hypothetical protein